jgi:hypothetical protein
MLERPDTIAKLESRWKTNSMNLQEFRDSSSAQKWSNYATEELASLLYPNMCRSLGDSYRAFGYVEKVDTFGTLDRLAIRGLGSIAMYMAANRVKSE